MLDAYAAPLLRSSNLLRDLTGKRPSSNLTIDRRHRVKQEDPAVAPRYSLVDRSNTQDASQLLALQDWFLRYELKTVPNVAEVASVGGMVCASGYLQTLDDKGVEIVPVYDRSGLIERAVKNLTHELAEEFLVVAVVSFVFLCHMRSAFVAIVSLPLGILAAFVVLHLQGVNANIMSLGGIAIAIGAMVDASVVMVENAHKHLERWGHEHPDQSLANDERWRVIGDSAAEVGPALFFSRLVITLSFIPVFTLEAQEGRLFAPSPSPRRMPWRRRRASRSR